ncbi:thiol reductant ABC exporter subunit CydC [Bacillus sp. FJAT-45350]|uniref:thiol reductant ABC exporter subunit CydC n=1 Tax=Bacillus sp. FJAT-45350 TaxID=2011014 RepID=UPI000BB9B568|nr:thiol reductant ABC exporter subunit CydC [Bacillus sp. FJAT-45350]
MKELIQIVRVMINKRRDMVLSIVFCYLAGITAVGLFAANGYLISQAALQPPLYILIGMVAVVKIGSIIRAGSRYGERYYSHRATFTMLSDLRVFFFEKLEKMSPSTIQQYRSGDLLARIVGDVESLQNFFLRVLYPPIIMVTVFLSTILFISFYTIEVVLLLTIGLLLTGLIIPAWFAKRQRAVSTNIIEERANLSTEITEWFQGFRELKIHQLVNKKEEQLVRASNAYISEQERASKQATVNHTVNLGTSFLIFWSVIAVSGYLVATGQLDGLFLAMIVMISLTLFDHSTPMATLPIYYEESERAAKRLHSVAMGQKEPEQKKKTVLSEDFSSITFDNVSLTFSGEHREAVKGVTFNLPAGSKTAIVGPSGSGKSTILKLLLNLYPPTSGEVLLGGIAVSDVEHEQLWAKTKVVLQENHYFAGTIKDNLLLSNDSLTDAELEELLAEAQLSHFTLSDQVMEKGENLSGGEKQRLTIARAVAKKGSLWLLDEPTSSLDTWTEQRVYDLLFSRGEDDTMVIISHRLSGLEKMDQIIVMDQGSIIEQGTFSELMEKNGYFYQLKQIEDSYLEN